MRHLSVAESMGALYGKSIRYITAITAVVCYIGILVFEFCVVDEVVKLFSTVKGTLPTIVVCTLVILYAVFEH